MQFFLKWLIKIHQGSSLVQKFYGGGRIFNYNLNIFNNSSSLLMSVLKFVIVSEFVHFSEVTKFIGMNYLYFLKVILVSVNSGYIPPFTFDMDNLCFSLFPHSS